MKCNILFVLIVVLCISFLTVLGEEEDHTIISGASKDEAPFIELNTIYRGKGAEQKGQRWWKFHTQKMGTYLIRIKNFNLRTLGTDPNYNSTIYIIDSWDEPQGHFSVPAPHGSPFQEDKKYDNKEIEMKFELKSNKDYWILSTSKFESAIYGNYWISVNTTTNTIPEATSNP